MKVVFLARWYPHKYDPMFGLFVQRHAEAATLYNDVSVIYVHPDPNASQAFELERREEKGVDVVRVYYKKTNKLSSSKPAGKPWHWWASPTSSTSMC